MPQERKRWKTIASCTETTNVKIGAIPEKLQPGINNYNNGKDPKPVIRKITHTTLDKAEACQKVSERLGLSGGEKLTKDDLDKVHLDAVSDTFSQLEAHALLFATAVHQCLKENETKNRNNAGMSIFDSIKISNDKLYNDPTPPKEEIKEEKLPFGHELWLTDGSINGMQFVKDINPGQDSSNPSEFSEINGLLYFSADDGSNGDELWVSDGTEEGTVLVRDLWEGWNYSTLINFCIPPNMIKM